MTRSLQSEDDDREQRLNDAICEVLERSESGIAIDRAAILARHPDLAPELTEFLDSQDFVLRKIDAARPLPQAPGLRVGRFLTSRIISSGPMSIVYEVEDEYIPGGPPASVESSTRLRPPRPRITRTISSARPRPSLSSITPTSCRSSRSTRQGPNPTSSCRWSTAPTCERSAASSPESAIRNRTKSPGHRERTSDRGTLRREQRESHLPLAPGEGRVRGLPAPSSHPRTNSETRLNLHGREPRCSRRSRRAGQPRFPHARCRIGRPAGGPRPGTRPSARNPPSRRQAVEPVAGFAGTRVPDRLRSGPSSGHRHADLTATGDIPGTLRYLAPSVCTAGAIRAATSTVWA